MPTNTNYLSYKRLGKKFNRDILISKCEYQRKRNDSMTRSQRKYFHFDIVDTVKCCYKDEQGIREHLVIIKINNFRSREKNITNTQLSSYFLSRVQKVAEFLFTLFHV